VIISILRISKGSVFAPHYGGETAEIDMKRRNCVTVTTTVQVKWSYNAQFTSLRGREETVEFRRVAVGKGGVNKALGAQTQSQYASRELWTGSNTRRGAI